MRALDACVGRCTDRFARRRGERADPFTSATSQLTGNNPHPHRGARGSPRANVVCVSLSAPSRPHASRAISRVLPWRPRRIEFSPPPPLDAPPSARTAEKRRGWARPVRGEPAGRQRAFTRDARASMCIHVYTEDLCTCTCTCTSARAGGGVSGGGGGGVC